MNIFENMEKYDYEQLVFCQDRKTGLKAIIGIHDTTLGPALGGTRIWNYENEDAAIMDVLRLSRGMTYKNAAAGLNLGGGKTVIIGDPQKMKSEEFFRVFGRFVEGLNGRYITAEDMNTTTEDMEYINMETDHVVGLKGKSGNPSPVTAFGTFKGILAGAREAFGTEDLKGKVVAVQGVGSVGYNLCKHLYEAGARLIVTDVKKSNIEKAVKDFNAEGVEPDEIYSVACDIFSPCAMGAVVNDFTLDKFNCKLIAGCANNVLAEERHGEILEEKGIVYVPDFVINAGGVINVYEEILGYNKERALAKAANVYDKVSEVFKISKEEHIPTYKAAERLAEKRIEAIKNVKSVYLK
ncbi:leucine dehydrogenase [Clostridium bovifaecis]|uniref:Leucine dehydrogenase n=1 Tax=Clostridium bovifaecis TaxID=2184719 RepID=A0A6I6F1D0_9CLOT|nr:leucine dehydrogenase [Clostridium bovifaecis]